MLKNRKFVIILLAFAVLATLIVSCKKQDTGVTGTKPADKVVVSEPTSTASTPAKSDSTVTTPKGTTTKIDNNASDVVYSAGDVVTGERTNVPASSNTVPEMKTDDSLKSEPKGRPSLDEVLKVWAFSNMLEDGDGNFGSSDNVNNSRNATYEEVKKAEESKKETATKQPITVKVIDKVEEKVDNYGVGDVDVVLVDGIYYPVRHTNEGSFVIVSDLNEDLDNVVDAVVNDVVKDVKVVQPKNEAKAIAGNSDKAQPKSNTNSNMLEDGDGNFGSSDNVNNSKNATYEKVKKAEESKKETATKQPITVKVIDRVEEKVNNYGVGDVDVVLVDGIYYPVRHTNEGSFVIMSDLNEDLDNVVDAVVNDVVKDVKVVQPKNEAKAIAGNSDKAQPKSNTKIVADKKDKNQPKSNAKLVADKNGKVQNVVLPTADPKVVVDNNTPNVTIVQPTADTRVVVDNKTPNVNVVLPTADPKVVVDNNTPNVIVVLPTADTKVVVDNNTPNVTIVQPTADPKVVVDNKTPNVNVVLPTADTRVVVDNKTPNVNVVLPTADPKVVVDNKTPNVNVVLPTADPKVVVDNKTPNVTVVQPTADTRVVVDNKTPNVNVVLPTADTKVVVDNDTTTKSVKADKKATKVKENKEPSDFFEGDWQASAYISPFAYQSVSFKYWTLGDGTLLDLVSKYGFGGRIKGTYLLKSGLYAAADLSVLSFNMKDHGFTTDYLSLFGMLKAGYKFGLTDKVYLFGETGAGVNFAFRADESRAYPIIGVGLGAGYNLNERWSVEGIVDGTWYWQKDKSGESWGAADTWGLYTFLGATYKF